MNLLEKRHETDCTSQEVNLYCNHQVSGHMQRRSPNDLVSMVVSVIHLLPYICGKT